jgi:hypothetical protein
MIHHRERTRATDTAASLEVIASKLRKRLPEKATKRGVTPDRFLYGWCEWSAFLNSSDASDSNLDAFDKNSAFGVFDCLINSIANSAAVTSDEAL